MNKDTLINKTSDAHDKTCGKPAAQISLAPGRVNLMGEHTDYNDGFVLPTAIDFFTCVCASPRDDMNVSVTALDFDGDVDQFDLCRDIKAHKDDIWKNYIRGAFRILKMENYPLGGCTLTISGTIPKGAGLSSSASLEIAVLNSLNELFNLGLDKIKMAQLGQKIENDFVGLSCGIMDQLSSACGVDGHAIQIDCRDLKISEVSIPSSLSLMIINSNVQRQLTTSAYNDRRYECDQAALIMGVKSLRDASKEILRTNKNNMPDLITRRAKHVITENDRVLKIRNALGTGDITMLSKIMAESHLSMKNLFEMSTPELDILVDIIAAQIGLNGGVRMTGGGFGGCVVALLPENLIDDVRGAIDREYHAQTGLTASIYLCKPTHGVITVEKRS